MDSKPKRIQSTGFWVCGILTALILGSCAPAKTLPAPPADIPLIRGISIVALNNRIGVVRDLVSDVFSRINAAEQYRPERLGVKLEIYPWDIRPEDANIIIDGYFDLRTRIITISLWKDFDLSDSDHVKALELEAAHELGHFAQFELLASKYPALDSAALTEIYSSETKNPEMFADFVAVKWAVRNRWSKQEFEAAFWKLVRRGPYSRNSIFGVSGESRFKINLKFYDSLKESPERWLKMHNASEEMSGEFQSFYDSLASF